MSKVISRRCREPGSCRGSGLFTTSPFPSGACAIHACQCSAGRKFGKPSKIVGYTAGIMGSIGTPFFCVPGGGYAYMQAPTNAGPPAAARSEIAGWTGEELERHLREGANGRKFTKTRRS